MSKMQYLAGAAVILCLALIIRTTDLYSLPLYHDEGDHLRWAQFFAQGQPNYPIFMDGKFLLGVTISQFQIVGPNSIWVARAAVAIISLLACAAGLGLGQLLGGRRLGLLAGLVYAVLPLSAFYERQIIADSLMAACGACGALFTVRLLHTGRWRWALPAALALGLSFASKLFGILFWAYPVVAAILLTRSWRAHIYRTASPALIQRISSATLKNNLLKSGAVLGLTLVTIGLIFFSLKSMWGYNNNLIVEQKVGHVTCPPLLCTGDLAKQWQYFQSGLNGLGEIAPLYFGWPLVILILLSWPLAPTSKRGLVGVVVLATLGMVLAFSSAAYFLPARYLVFLALPVSLLGAAGGLWLADRVPAGTPRWVASGLLLLINIFPALLTFNLITQPAQAAMPYDDRVNYITGPIAGTGMLQATRDILAREAGNPVPPVIVFAHGFKEQLNQVLVHFDVTKVKAVIIDNVNIHDVGLWLTNRTPVYIFDAIKADPNIPPKDDGLYPGLIAEETARYPHLDGVEWMRVRHVTGADADLRQKLFAEFFIRPNEIPSTYQALADSLPPTGDLALALYPPSQAAVLTPLLASKPNITVYPIGDSWPLDVSQTEQELTSIAYTHSNVRVVFLGETTGDPDRQLETWLNTHWYRLSESWLEPVRTLDYVTGEGSGQTVATNIQFEDCISLDSVNLLDPVVAPGGIVRLQLHWRAANPLTNQYKIFVHLFNGDKIIAQHDGQAMGELRPTTTWQPGESIVDQFAIQLPPDVAPGDYSLRIGLYDLATQARLPLITGEEFWVGGTLAIK